MIASQARQICYTEQVISNRTLEDPYWRKSIAAGMQREAIRGAWSTLQRGAWSTLQRGFGFKLIRGHKWIQCHRISIYSCALGFNMSN